MIVLNDDTLFNGAIFFLTEPIAFWLRVTSEHRQSCSLASVIFRVKGVGNILLISNVTDSENKAATLQWLTIFCFHENNMHSKI